MALSVFKGMAVPTFREFVADAIIHAIGLLVGAAGSLALIVAAAIDGKASKLTAIIVYTGGLIAMLGCARPRPALGRDLFGTRLGWSYCDRAVERDAGTLNADPARGWRTCVFDRRHLPRLGESALPEGRLARLRSCRRDAALCRRVRGRGHRIRFMKVAH